MKNKKIAILTQKGKLSTEISTETTFNIFEMENDNVVGVEQDKITNSTDSHISLWLKTKRITELYIEEINAELKKILIQTGIIVKEKEELTNNQFFNGFVFAK